MCLFASASDFHLPMGMNITTKWVKAIPLRNLDTPFILFAAVVLRDLIHYTPVLPVLFLVRGRHLIQDKFRKCDILAKIHHTSENVASWEYYFPRCHVFRSVMYLGKQYSQDATFSELSWIRCRPLAKSKTGKTGV